MKNQASALQLLSLLALSTPSSLARASDDVKHEVKKDAHEVKRSAKKTGHRVEEATCMGTKAECETKKAKHRVEETSDKVGDKVNEMTE